MRALRWIFLAMMAAGLTACSAQTSDPDAARTPADTQPRGSAMAGDDGVAVPPSVIPPSAAARVAASFAKAWARPDLPAGQSWKGIAPYCEDGYAKLLRSVDPANVPAAAVTGTPRPASSTATGATHDVPSNAGVPTTTLAHLNGASLVTTAEHNDEDKP